MNHHRSAQVTSTAPAMPQRRRVLSAALLGLGCAHVGATTAWRPSRAMQLVVAFTPGGLPDLLSRRLAPHLQAELGQTVTVENKPGASGQIGAEAVLRAPADGHTLLTGFLGPGGLLPAFKLPPTDETGAEGFEPVGMLAEANAVVVTSTANRWTDLRDLAADVRSKPGFVPSFGSPGSGTILRLYCEMICARMGRPGLHAAYKGVGPVLTDVAAGNITFSAVTVPAAMPLIAAGKIKPLAVTSGMRVPGLASVKSLTDQGFSELDVSGWYGVWVSAAVAPAAVLEINRSIGRFLTGQDIDASFAAMGLTRVVPQSPAQVRARLEKDMTVWKKAVRELNLKLET